VRVGVDLDASRIAGLLAGERVELDDLLDLVAEQREPPGAVSRWAGNTSTVSPRTRNEPRWKAMSLRLYCSATRSASSWRWSMRSPTVSWKVMAE
jgi:hypothetical protein